MKNWRVLLSVTFTFTLIAIVLSSSFVFAQTMKNEVMEKKCEAAKEGIEVDNQVKKSCASYFEATEANMVIGVTAHAAKAAGEFSPNTIAYLALGLSTVAVILLTVIGGL
jgi:hypothetical protein